MKLKDRIRFWFFMRRYSDPQVALAKLRYGDEWLDYFGGKEDYREYVRNVFLNKVKD